MKKNRFSIQSIVVVGLMASLVFVFTLLNFPIPTPLEKTMVHLGNAMCLLSALLFGKWKGGLAAGIGSMIFDLLDPIYLPEAWVTFLTKFAMGFICGLIAHSFSKNAGLKKKNVFYVVGAVSGALSYVVLYTSKIVITKYLIEGLAWETVLATLTIKVPTSLFNAVTAVIISLILNAALRPSLKKANLSEKFGIV
ncbi:MAG: ECF transporter S component [Oscillospiraceae bacterium]